MNFQNNSEMDSLSGFDSNYLKDKSIRRGRDSTRVRTSRNSSVISAVSGPESKYYKMKKLVVAIKEYLRNSTEELALLVNRYLQALSLTIDLTIFDPHTNIASEFYVSLYELMKNVEARSPFAWNCVDVLSNACRNSSARHALIHTYQFVPSLSRILGDQITVEKKIRILKLLQDLTCGIKISWQIPHLPHLMKTLARWVESQDEAMVALSLGILVNLCYKNLPAVYTLNSNVDIKKLIKTCMTMTGPILEAHTCKLLIICDYHDLKPLKNFSKLVNITYMSIKKALENKDHILLRQLIEFYIDVKNQQIGKEDNDVHQLYEGETAELLKVLERIISSTDSTDGQGDTYNLGECIALIFQFIHHLIEMNLDCLKQFYPKFIKISLGWIQNDIVSPHSISILKTIAVNTAPNESHMLKPIGVSLQVFLLALESSNQEDIPTNSEYNRKIGALLQLLRVLMRVDHLKAKILMELKEEIIYKVFYPLIGDDSPRLSDLTCSEESVNLYIYAIALVDELAKHDLKWISIRENLLEQRQIHLILSQALYNGSNELKSLILELALLPSFPRKDIATAMTSIQNMVNFNPPLQSKCHNEITNPLLSVTQIEKVDILIDKLKDVVANKNFVGHSTSDVIELYEYKLATMGHAERAAMASVEAASERCTHLQHRNAKLIAETSRMQQLLFHTQQRNEEFAKTKKEIEESLRLTQGRCKVVQSKLTQEEQKSAKLQEEFDETTKKLTEVYEAKAQLDEQHTKLKQLISKLEDNCSRLEKNLSKKEDALKKSGAQNEELRTQVTSLELTLNMKQEILDKRNEELEKTLEELKIKRQIIDTITNIAQQKN